MEPEALAPDKLQLIEEYTDNIRPLFEDAPSKMVILTKGQVAPKFAVAAPHYAVFYASPGRQGLLNAGYQLQQLDLCLSAVGLGSCYLGMAKPQKEFLTHEGLSYLLMLAFGTPSIPCHRNGPNQFDRKPADEIAEGLSKELIEPVRLAPSADNGQPWYFTQSGKSVQVWKQKKFSLKSLFIGDLDYADMGVALCHLRTSLERAGVSCDFDFTPKSPVKGYEPVCSAIMS
jgi:hypothetical protein